MYKSCHANGGSVVFRQVSLKALKDKLCFSYFTPEKTIDIPILHVRSLHILKLGLFFNKSSVVRCNFSFFLNHNFA